VRYRLIAGTINRYEPEEGWTNVHMDVSPRPIWMGDLRFAVLPDVIGSIASMPDFRNEMFDAVQLWHVLEHLSYDDANDALAEVFRILKPLGVLDVEVPDVARVVDAWLAGQLDDDGFQQWIYGEQLPRHEPGDSHRWGWWEPTLRAALHVAGFQVGEREETGLALRFIATKPEVEE
jgi:ubiquinone/menaquinone biosynthesis C-methylase UbiE